MPKKLRNSPITVITLIILFTFLWIISFSFISENPIEQLISVVQSLKGKIEQKAKPRNNSGSSSKLSSDLVAPRISYYTSLSNSKNLPQMPDNSGSPGNSNLSINKLAWSKI